MAFQFVVIQKMCCNVMYQLLLSIMITSCLYRLHYIFFSHDTMTPQREPKKRKRKAIFVVKFALSVCVFMIVTYLLSQLPNHTPHPPPEIDNHILEQLC